VVFGWDKTDLLVCLRNGLALELVVYTKIFVFLTFVITFVSFRGLDYWLFFIESENLGDGLVQQLSFRIAQQ